MRGCRDVSAGKGTCCLCLLIARIKVCSTTTQQFAFYHWVPLYRLQAHSAWCPRNIGNLPIPSCELLLSAEVGGHTFLASSLCYSLPWPNLQSLGGCSVYTWVGKTAEWESTSLALSCSPPWRKRRKSRWTKPPESIGLTVARWICAQVFLPTLLLLGSIYSKYFLFSCSSFTYFSFLLVGRVAGSHYVILVGIYYVNHWP